MPCCAGRRCCGDTFAMRDRVRNLLLAPWREAGGDGARLRLARLAAALTRLDTAWSAGADRAGRVTRGAPRTSWSRAVGRSRSRRRRRSPSPWWTRCAGRAARPCSWTTRACWARSERSRTPDRRRLLADLLDDALVPLGSAIVAADLRPGRNAGTLRLTASGIDTELELTPGSIQLVDLPPGIAGTAELETREGAWLGVRAKRFALDVTGGLCGLLVDTREVPLRLPERSERRREVIDAWERPLWIGGDT